MTCQQTIAAIHLYLDGELQPAESLHFEAHLVDCPKCRAQYESLLSVVQTIRAAQPLYKAPEESLTKARSRVVAHRNRLLVYRSAIAASVLLVGMLSAALLRNRASAEDPFATFAADAHLRHGRGALPLDIGSDEPDVVAGWLSSRLPFHLSLPNYPQQAGEPKRYSLVGARLLQYQQEDVAYLAYQMEEKPISLVIAASSHVVPSGGDVYQSGGLSFHTTSYKGLRMITWVDKGLSYSLVSDLNAVGAESCVICHGGKEERRKFEPLRPRL